MSFLEDIKAIPITDIAEKLGLHLKRIGKYYSLVEYDSTLIDVEKNCFWRNSRFSQGFKGGAGSSIDFIMEFAGETNCRDAMKRLAGMYGINKKNSEKPRYEKQGKQEPNTAVQKKGYKQLLWLPVKDNNNSRVFQYLLGRGISEEIINFFLDRDMLYQDIRKNCVFVSPMRDFACIRGTDKKRRFIKDCMGCNYESCFFFKGDNADRLVMAESVIDVMSIMTYMNHYCISYKEYAYLATSGTNKVQSLFYHIQNEQPKINKIYLCNDNDDAGADADKKAEYGLKKMGYEGECKIEKSPKGKDWNEYINLLKREGE